MQEVEAKVTEKRDAFFKEGSAKITAAKAEMKNVTETFIEAQ